MIDYNLCHKPLGIHNATSYTFRKANLTHSSCTVHFLVLYTVEDTVALASTLDQRINLCDLLPVHINLPVSGLRFS